MATSSDRFVALMSGPAAPIRSTTEVWKTANGETLLELEATRKSAFVTSISLGEASLRQLAVAAIEAADMLAARAAEKGGAA